MDKFRLEYLELIEFAKSQNRGTRKLKEHERHHIIPNCLGGSNEHYNLVNLTKIEHIRAHVLLAKSLEIDPLLCAWFMTHNRLHEGEVYEEYNDLLTSYKNLVSIRVTGEGNGMYGREQTPESRKKMSENGMGRPGWCKGLTKETSPSLMAQSKKLSAQKQGVPLPEKHKKAISLGTTGAKNPRALKIDIFDQNGVLQFKCHGNFKKVCEENGLPNLYLKRSALAGGTPITLKKSRGQYAKKHQPFEGWYAMII